MSDKIPNENVNRLMELIQSDYAAFWREVYAEGMTADHQAALDLSPEDNEDNEADCQFSLPLIQAKTL